MLVNLTLNNYISNSIVIKQSDIVDNKITASKKRADEEQMYQYSAQLERTIVRFIHS